MNPPAAKPGPANPSRSRGRLIGLTLSGVLLVIAGAFALHKEQPGSAQKDPAGATRAEAPGGGGPPSVQVIKPQRRTMAYTLTLPGNIAAMYQTTLYTKVSGYLKSISVDKGDEVTKGQIIAVIDAPEVKDLYEQAASDYAIKLLTYERLAGVFKDNPDVIAKQDVDVAQATAKAARHLRDSRRTLMGYMQVEAPFSGTITARFADPGALIQAATGSATQSTPLYTIMSLETVRIYVSVPQEDARLAVPGLPVTFTSKELAESEIKGTITRTTEALDPTTRTLLVEIDMPNKEHRLQPGMYVTATLYLSQHLQALAIPPVAVVPGVNGKSKSVFIVEQDRVRQVPIKTGIDNGVMIEVVEGLSGNEDVVVVGKENCSDGQVVKATPSNLPEGKSSAQKF